MNKQTFEHATRVNRSIEHFEEMKMTLKETFTNLTRNNNEEDAQTLGRLIYELMYKPKGEYIVNAFVNHFTLKIDETIKKLQKEFHEL